jgi:tripartite-type tricarboxylate transporter receptor subunit TctC
MEIVGGIPSGVDGPFVASSTGWKSFSDVQKAASVKAINLTTGSNALLENALLGAYGIKAKVITGYANTAALATGFQRGDGQLASMPASDLVDAIKDGKVTMLLTEAAPKTTNTLYAQLKNVPTLAQVVSQDPPSTASGKKALTALSATILTGQDVAAPKGTPTSEVAAMTAAMQWAESQPGMVSAEAKQGLSGGFVAPSTVTTQIATSYNNASALAPYAGSSS